MSNKKLMFGVILACLLGTAIAQTPTITISTNNTPLDRRALQDLSAEAFKRIGYEVKITSLPSERSLHEANAGAVDGEGLRVSGLGEKYPDLVQVPERFVGISFVAFGRDASINLDKGWDSLKPYRVAFINGWKMFEANASAARIVRKVDKPEQMFQMLDGGRIDLALYTRADGIALIREFKLSSIAPLTPSLKDVDMYLYLHKRHAQLAPKLAKALQDMKADGTYNKIMFSILTE